MKIVLDSGELVSIITSHLVNVGLLTEGDNGKVELVDDTAEITIMSDTSCIEKPAPTQTRRRRRKKKAEPAEEKPSTVKEKLDEAADGDVKEQSPETDFNDSGSSDSNTGAEAAEQTDDSDEESLFA